MKHIQENKLDLYSFTPEKGESINTFKKRVLGMYEKFMENESDETILFITHGGVITQLLLHVLNIEDKHYYKYHPEHCAISIIEIKDKEVKVQFIKEE